MTSFLTESHRILKIQVMKALAGMKDDMHFEIDEFVPSADFQDLFDTIKLNVK